MESPALVAGAAVIILVGVGMAQTYSVGDLVAVSPDTNAGVHPRHACGFNGRITGCKVNGDYLVRDVLSQSGGRSIAVEPRRVSTGCSDGLSALHMRGGRADSSVGRALSAEKLSAELASLDADEARAETAALRQRLENETGRRKIAETAAVASKRETASVMKGDTKNPSLTRVGRLAAATIAEAARGDTEREIYRLRNALDNAVKIAANEKKRFREISADFQSKLDTASCLKNKMATRARKAENKMAKAQAQTDRILGRLPVDTARPSQGKKRSSLEKDSTAFLPQALRQRLAGAQAETVAAEERAEKAEDDLQGLLNRLCPKSLKIFNEAVRERESIEFAAANPERCRPLVSELGQKDEPYSQHIVELGLEIMSTGVTPDQARYILGAILRKENPDLVEGKDYRLPHAQQFDKWRHFIGPVSHYIACRILKMGKNWYALHDASTKGGGWHIFCTSACVCIESVHGDELVLTVPLKVVVCPSGKSGAEAKLIKSSIRCSHGDGQYGSLLNCDAGISDHAALATTRELLPLKQAEADEIRALLEGAEGSAVIAKELEVAAKLWLCKSPEQKAEVQRIHVLGCKDHGNNLTSEAGHAKSENSALEHCMVNDRAADTIARWVLRRKNGYSWKRIPKTYEGLGFRLCKEPLKRHPFRIYPDRVCQPRSSSLL